MDKDDRRDRDLGDRRRQRLESSGGGWMKRWEMDKHKEEIGNVEVEKVNLGDIGT